MIRCCWCLAAPAAPERPGRCAGGTVGSGMRPGAAPGAGPAPGAAASAPPGPAPGGGSALRSARLVFWLIMENSNSCRSGCRVALLAAPPALLSFSRLAKLIPERSRSPWQRFGFACLLGFFGDAMGFWRCCGMEGNCQQRVSKKTFCIPKHQPLPLWLRC